MNRRLARIAAASLLALGVPASSALATPPDGNCPPPFHASSLEAMLAEFPRLETELGYDAMAWLVDAVDINGNGEICLMPHPPQSASAETRTILVNIVDDTAAPHAGGSR